MKSLGAQAARGGMITLIFQLAKVLIVLGTTVVLARLLDPTDYGLIAMAVAIIGVAEIFRDFGLSMAALQAKELSHEQQSNLFWINAGVGLGLGLIVCALAPLIAAFYGEPRLLAIVLVLSITFFIGGLTTQFRVRINRELRFLTLAWTDLAPYVLALAVALVGAVAGLGYWALVGQQLTIAIASLVLSVTMSRWWPGLPKRGHDMRSLLNFGMSFALTQLISYATRNVDSIAVGRVWGTASLGLYDRAYQLVMAPLNQVNAPLSRVAIPVLSRVADDRERFSAYLRQAQLIAIYLTSTLFLVLAGLGVPIVTVLMGEQWAFAGVILSVLAVGGVFRAVNQIAYWIYMSRGLAAQQLRFFLIAQPLVLAVMLAGLPWGPLGVAVGNAIGFAAYWVASLLWAGRCANVDVAPLMRDALRTMLTVGLPAGAIALSATLFVPGDVLKIVVGLAGAAAWLGLSFLLLPTVRRDVAVLRTFVLRATGRGKS